MKKITMLLLIACLFLTLTASATQSSETISVPLNDHSIELIVGGEFWCSFGIFSNVFWIDVAIGLAGVSFGWSLAVGAVGFAATALIC